MRYDLIRKGGNVKRFHTHNTIRENTVAAHSWGVATILLHICEPSANLIRAALYHDVFEYATGDVPYSAKRDNPELKSALDIAEERFAKILEIDTMWNLLPGEEDLLKIADMLDLMYYCTEEIEMGNAPMVDIWNNGYRVVAGLMRVEQNESYKVGLLLTNLTERVRECQKT